MGNAAPHAVKHFDSQGVLICHRCVCGCLKMRENSRDQNIGSFTYGPNS
jgi:hypothetical protein